MPSTKKPKPKTAKQLAEEVIAERKAEPPKKRRVKKATRHAVAGSRTEIAKDVRKGKRKPPPVPKDKTLEEIAEMDPDDPAFKHPQGRPRKYEGKDPKEMSWKDSIRAAEQEGKNKKRAKVRKREAEIVKTEERVRMERGGRPIAMNRKDENDAPGVTAEDKMYAEGLLNMEDWDDEELIRGYRKMRNGRFGTPPKYIPREVQQKALRLIIQRGKRKLDGAYIKATDLLVQLAQNAESEKVKLEAIKEVMDRVGGKVPEHMKVSSEVAPYEAFLADSLETVTETTTARATESEWELEFGDDEQAALPEGDNVLEAEVVD